MTRLVFVLAIVIVIALIYRSVRNYSGQNNRLPRRVTPKNMVRCRYCGLHLPEDQALSIDGRSYCSEEHKMLGEDKKTH